MKQVGGKKETEAKYQQFINLKTYLNDFPDL